MNKRTIKMAVFDIDGTIYDHDAKKIHTETITSFEKLKSQGIKVGICTSRTFEETNNIDDDILDEMDFIITSAGSRVTIDHKDVFTKTLSKSELNNLFSYADQHQLAVRYSDINRQGYFNFDVDEILKQWFIQSFDYLPSIKPYDQEEVVNVAVIDENISDHIAALKKITPNAQHVLMQDIYFEITPKNINKASALDFLCDYYGINKDNIIAFGDGENDAEMLKNAGFGVAMENGSDITKAAADYITEAVDEGGISHALKRFGVI